MSDLLYVVVDCVVSKEEDDVDVVVEIDVEDEVVTGVNVEETVVEDEVVTVVVNGVVVEDDVVEDEHKVGRGIHSPRSPIFLQVISAFVSGSNLQNPRHLDP